MGGGGDVPLTLQRQYAVAQKGATAGAAFLSRKGRGGEWACGGRTHEWVVVGTYPSPCSASTQLRKAQLRALLSSSAGGEEGNGRAEAGLTNGWWWGRTPHLAAPVRSCAKRRNCGRCFPLPQGERRGMGVRRPDS